MRRCRSLTPLPFNCGPWVSTRQLAASLVSLKKKRKMPAPSGLRSGELCRHQHVQRSPVSAIVRPKTEQSYLGLSLHAALRRISSARPLRPTLPELKSQTMVCYRSRAAKESQPPELPTNTSECSKDQSSRVGPEPRTIRQFQCGASTLAVTRAD